MKKSVFFLILLNVVVFLVGGIFAARTYYKKSNEDVLGPLKMVSKIDFRHIDTKFGFSIEKSSRTHKWSISWDDETWQVNENKIAEVYVRLADYLAKRNLTDHYYEVTVNFKKSQQTVKLSAEDINYVFWGQKNSAKLPDKDLVRELLNEMIFSRVRDNCRNFKIKIKENEYIFSNRYNKWFLENLGENMEVSNDVVTRLFHAIFSLSATKIEFLNDHLSNYDVMPDFSISLYKNNARERVDFFYLDSERSFVKNDAVGLTFGITSNDFASILNAISSLLELNVFSIHSCEDIDFTLPNADEHFNLHDAKGQNKWQLTYSKDGNFQVKELTEERFNTVLNFLNTIKSINVLSDIPEERKIFSMTVDKLSKEPKVFNFYKNADHLYVEEDGKRVKFEINASFVPMIFQMLRSNVSEGRLL